MNGTGPTDQEDTIWNERHKLLIAGTGDGHLPIGACLAGGAVLLLLGHFVLGRL